MAIKVRIDSEGIHGCSPKQLSEGTWLVTNEQWDALVRVARAAGVAVRDGLSRSNLAIELKWLKLQFPDLDLGSIEPGQEAKLCEEFLAARKENMAAPLSAIATRFKGQNRG
jgi:hypothetical protein